MSKVSVTINGTQIQVEEGTPILFAASAAGVKIPTLCFMPRINEIGSCRVCVVEVEGQEGLVAACNNPVADGMVIRTNTPRVVQARKKNIEHLLSHHNVACTSCVRQETCTLRKLASDFNVLPESSDQPAAPWDQNFPLIRDTSKCVRCLKCVAVCSKIQHCNVWTTAKNGSNQIRVQGGTINNSGCALCGQCVVNCPTGALTARDDTQKIIDALADPETAVVVQVAPAVRAAWGEGIGLSHEEATVGRMVSALRSLGFDRVFDTDFAADLTIMEEGSEFVEFLKSDKPRPMYTSCCPGWVRFAKLHYPGHVSRLSSAKSPHQMFGATAKHILSHEEDLDGKKLFVVSIMPCVAKKYECGVPELSTDAGQDVDAVLTVREFDRLLRMFQIDCAHLEDSEFDQPMGQSTGAATIFGRTGGVMEAALRSAVFLLTGENPDFSTCDTSEATPAQPWLAKKLDVAGTEVTIAVVSGLENTSKLLDAIDAGEEAFDFVEVMACPGGCVNGGGQPIHERMAPVKTRTGVLNTLDAHDTLRRSHENPAVAALYEQYVEAPLSHVAHDWLHTDQETWSIH